MRLYGGRPNADGNGARYHLLVTESVALTAVARHSPCHRAIRNRATRHEGRTYHVSWRANCAPLSTGVAAPCLMPLLFLSAASSTAWQPHATSSINWRDADGAYRRTLDAQRLAALAWRRAPRAAQWASFTARAKHHEHRARQSGKPLPAKTWFGYHASLNS